MTEPVPSRHLQRIPTAKARNVASKGMAEAEPAIWPREALLIVKQTAVVADGLGSPILLEQERFSNLLWPILHLAEDLEA